MIPPDELNVLDQLGGFTACTSLGFLYRCPSIVDKLLKKGTIGKLVWFTEKSFYQGNNNVTEAYYKVPGYGYRVAVWFDNETQKRILGEFNDI